MDHNERAQSVVGLEQAEVLEIVDHHRLADIETKNPIYVRNEPVGSTTTIVAGMYQEKGLMPTAKMAGLMAAAIVSDTVMFKSPTCTQRDIDMANRMSRIANVSLEELGKAIFSVTSGDDKTVDAMLRTDYKEFHIAGHALAVSQITCMDSERLLGRKEDFLQAMQTIRKERQFDTAILMITDALLEGTQLLFVGDEEDHPAGLQPPGDGGQLRLRAEDHVPEEAGHPHAVGSVGLDLFKTGRSSSRESLHERCFQRSEKRPGPRAWRFCSFTTKERAFSASFWYRRDGQGDGEGGKDQCGQRGRSR